MSADILGSGFAFPLRVNGQGGIARSRHANKVREAVFVILATQRGERVMRPDFGCNLGSLVFAPNNAATANLARHHVETGLRRWEPRIVLDEVIVENDNAGGRLIVHVHYRLRATLEADNLVYPFYLGEGAP